MNVWLKMLTLVGIGTLLLAGCGQGSSGGDSTVASVPLAYTGKTDVAAVDSLDENQQNDLAIAATHGAATVIDYMREDQSLALRFLATVVKNTGATELAVPTSEQVLESPNPCTESKGSISYRDLDGQGRYLIVRFSNACVPTFTTAEVDTINSIGSTATGAIGLAILGIPSSATEMPLTVSGTLFVDSQYHAFYPSQLTVLDDESHQAVTIKPGSYQLGAADFISRWQGSGVSTLFLCGDSVCKAHIYAFDKDANGSYSSPVGSSCIADCSSANPIYGPVESIPQTVYVSAFGEVFVEADQLLPCSPNLEAGQNSPFQSGSLTLTGASGSLTVTYNGCGQPFTVTSSS